MFRRRLKPKNGFILAAPAILDLLFLLQIFFMIGSNVIVQPGIAIGYANTHEDEPKMGVPKMVIYFTKERQLYFNDQTIEDWEALEARLVDFSDTKPIIIISADKATSLNDFARIMSLARRYASKVYLPVEAQTE
jgi:biopolymer transport protein ExbD